MARSFVLFGGLRVFFGDLCPLSLRGVKWDSRSVPPSPLFSPPAKGTLPAGNLYQSTASQSYLRTPLSSSNGFSFLDSLTLFLGFPPWYSSSLPDVKLLKPSPVQGGGGGPWYPFSFAFDNRKPSRQSVFPPPLFYGFLPVGPTLPILVWDPTFFEAFTYSGTSCKRVLLPPLFNQGNECNPSFFFSRLIGSLSLVYPTTFLSLTDRGVPLAHFHSFLFSPGLFFPYLPMSSFFTLPSPFLPG